MRIRNRVGLRAVALGGAMALMASVGFAGSAGAAQTVPPVPTVFGVAPLFQNTSGAVSEIDRSAGSDTTLFMMQTIGDLYNDAGLYGCVPNTNDATCNFSPSPDGANLTVTDTVDNYMRTEILNGINNIGSGTGQKELCGTNTGPDAVDFARSSKDPDPANCGSNLMLGLGYAKDSVPAVDFPAISPAQVGAATYYDTAANANAENASGGLVYAPTDIIDANEVSNGGAANGASCTSSITPCSFLTLPGLPGSGKIGPVAAGWLPTDPTNCVAAGSGLSGTPCSGTPFTDIEGANSTADGSGGGVHTAAFRLFCDTGVNRIYDWGQLTNLSGSEVPGQGTPIGVPIRIAEVNTGSGTAYTFAEFANSNVASTAPTPDPSGSAPSSTCQSSANVMDINGASQQNPFIGDGPSNPTTNLDTVVENNEAQLGAVAEADFTNDPADQAFELATSLYFMSYGVATTNTKDAQASLSGSAFGTAPTTCSGGVTTDCVPSGVPTTYAGQLMNEDGIAATSTTELTNQYPTSRTLWNAVLPTALRGSTAGFLNWICDNNSEIQKENDVITGLNYNTLLTNIIVNQYGFDRLTDTTAERSTTSYQAPDGLNSPNGACEAAIQVTTTGTANQVTWDGQVVTTPTGAFGAGGSLINTSSVPGGVHFDGETVGSTTYASVPVNAESGATNQVPSGTTISSISGTTLTLSNSLSEPSGTTLTLLMPGTAPILAVSTPGT